MRKKGTKIYDCFFYFDEIEILNLRLELLNEKVDKFIVIECEQSFNFKRKENFLSLEDLSSDFPVDKITILRIPEIDLNSVYSKYKKFRNLYPPKKQLIDNLILEDIQKYALFCLVEFLMSDNLLLEDLIFLSDVDEIPDLNFLEDIEKLLIYGPVLLKQSNFIWSDEIKLMRKHEGSVLFDFAKVVSNNKVFQESYFSKNKLQSRANSFPCGWHLSHFYDIDRTLTKLSLIHPNIKLDRNSLIKSFTNLLNPIDNLFGVIEPLIENENPLPFSTKILPKPYLIRKSQKKILISFKDVDENFKKRFDKFLLLSYNKKFLPKKPLYQNSEDLFELNEIPKILVDEFLWNKDLIYILLEDGVELSELNFDSNYIDKNHRFVIFDWKTIKNNILSDLIYPEITSLS